MSYYGGYGYGGGGDSADDVFVKAAVEVKRFLPSLFNIKVVRRTDLVEFKDRRRRTRCVRKQPRAVVVASDVTLESRPARRCPAFCNL